MSRHGYTLIEVMTAVVVMTIGATGIVAMQGAAVRANQDANESSTAINFGTTWLERVKRDARRWIANGSADLDAANNSYLNNVLAANGTWFVPAATAPEQVAADYYGFDTAGDFDTKPDPAADPAVEAAPAHFCVNMATTVVHAFNPITGTMTVPADTNAIRADIRVWWYRSATDTNRGAATCRARELTALQLAMPQIRKTYLSTVVSWREPGWP